SFWVRLRGPNLLKVRNMKPRERRNAARPATGSALADTDVSVGDVSFGVPGTCCIGRETSTDAVDLLLAQHAGTPASKHSVVIHPFLPSYISGPPARLPKIWQRSHERWPARR